MWLKWGVCLVAFSVFITLLIFQEGDRGSPCEKTGRNYDSLISHEEDIRNDSTQLHNLQNKFAFLSDSLVNWLAGNSIVFNFGIFIEIMGKLQCNAFGIQDAYYQKVGEGLYLGPSVLDHSCDRNASYYFEGIRICVIAKCAISGLSEVIPMKNYCFVCALE